MKQHGKNLNMFTLPALQLCTRDMEPTTTIILHHLQPYHLLQIKRKPIFRYLVLLCWVFQNKGKMNDAEIFALRWNYETIWFHSAKGCSARWGHSWKTVIKIFLCWLNWKSIRNKFQVDHTNSSSQCLRP